MPEASTGELTSARLLAAGRGWRVRDVVCHAGPAHPAFDEAHAWPTIAPVLAGVFTYRGERGPTLLSPGSVLLGRPGHGYRCSHEHTTGDRCVSFTVEPELIEEVAADLPGVRSAAFGADRLPPRPTLLPLLQEVGALAAGRGGDPEELSLRLVAAALREEAQPGPPTSQRDLDRVARTVRRLEEDVASPQHLAGLAEQVGMRRYHFLRTFRRVVGETPYRYLLHRRLAWAADQLVEGEERVVDVALACGFGDLSEFTRHFHARFGASPGAYRRRSAAR